MKAFIEFVGGLIATVGVVAFFVGVIMLFLAFKKKKPMKNLGIVTGAGFILILIGGSILPPIEEQAEDPKEIKEESSDNEKKVNEEKSEAKEIEKHLSIDKKLIKNNNHVDEATIDDKGFLTISYKATAAWSENSIVTTYTYWMFEALNEGFKDPSVNEVEASIKTKVTDNKGNSSVKEVASFLYTRETFEELNYDGFLYLASGQEWRIYNEADVYFIYPVIYNNIKEDFKKNLVSGTSKVPPITK